MALSNIHISDFKTQFSGGTRQNRFLIEGTIPYGGGQISKFHVRATQIPALSTLPIEYNWMGRKGFYPGEKQYQTWSVAVIDDTGTNDTWKKIHNWHNNINNHVTNNSAIPTTSSTYKANYWTIKHLNLNGNESTPLKEFKMYGIWPRTIMDIPLNMANPNTINQFTVIFLYDWITISNVTQQVGGTTPD